MMYSILSKIFSEYNYQAITKDSKYNFYENLNQEYFITIEYSVKELNDFFETNKTDKLLEHFEEAQLRRNDVKKNTTLYIFVETDNIEIFYNENKNTIFKIEEDQYYFRKHIIVYTKKGISSINTKENISSQLNTILMKEDSINNFIHNYYEDEEYFIAIQLVAKIPFLVINHVEIPYERFWKK
ncbi:ABC-three component system middle component 1 [Staphylococcus equorum]|uniref:ABC-three component system middle component 1 n=1 Tax=Staphylococcus equorum TaxID=246432 RepID=UPI003CF4133E